MEPENPGLEDYDGVLRRSFNWRYAKGQDVWTREDALRKVADIAVKAMSANGARRILDIGIGNGAHAEAILSDQTRRLTGIDIVTPPVWPDLRDRFGDRIELHEADFLGWAPSSDAFDFVMDLGCYHHQAPEAHAPYLEKIRALTTRRGRFLLCVYGAEPEAASAVSEEKTDHGRLSYRFTPDALEARLADAGFESIELKRVERPSLREHYLVAVSGPARSRS